MKNIIRVSVLVLMFSVSHAQNNTEQLEKNKIHSILDNWHLAASKANFTAYFNVLAEDSYFLGTDATEKWNKKDFIAYAKPHFDKGRAWSFTVIERSVYFNNSKDCLLYTSPSPRD